MRFDVGCRLRYRVDEANTFVFNIAVADSPCQQVEQERLEIEPDLIVEELRLLEGSRHMRLHAPVGELTLDYQASGTLHPIQADPQGLGVLESAPASGGGGYGRDAGCWQGPPQSPPRSAA